MEYMCFNQEGGFFTQNVGYVKLGDMFMNFGSSVSSTESEINMRLVKAWTAIDRVSIIWKFDLSDQKWDFFQAAVVSIILYGCTA